jgi:polysaccharide biosynthesis protein PslH
VCPGAVGAQCAARRSHISHILYISHVPPVPAKLGPARRNYHVIDQLSRFYDVSVLSIGTQEKAELFASELADRVSQWEFVAPSGGRRQQLVRKLWRTLRGRCDFLPAVEPALIQRTSAMLSTGSFDAVFLSCALLGGLPFLRGTTIIGDTHNVEFDVLRQMSTAATSSLRRVYAQRQWVAMRREEQRSVSHVHLLLATSARDQQMFQTELKIERVAVVPNGIDVGEFAPAAGPGEPGVILFSGLMSYYPNQQAIQWFLHSIFPRILREVPKARLIVAGAAPPRWLTGRRGSNVHVTGPVPDMRPYLERASVAIAPLRIGGGTRVKILEAQAAGRAVVSTSVGAEGLGLCHGESILLADTAETFGREVIRLLESPALAERIAANARKHVIQHFDWNRIGARLDSLLQRHAGLVPRRASPEVVALAVPGSRE